MAYRVEHAKIEGPAPYWYLLERWDEAHREQAMRRARQYAIGNGGYVCVKDNDGNVVFGTDPAQLDRNIAQGGNKYFTAPSKIGA